MCDESRVAGFLSAAAVALAAAIAFIIAAAAANASFFAAAGSPALMVAAGIATAAAAAGVRLGLSAMETYTACMIEANPRANECIGLFENYHRVTTGLAIVLGIQASACFAAAGIAWIPWAGQAPMYVILGALIVQVPLIASLLYYLFSLRDCLRR